MFRLIGSLLIGFVVLFSGLDIVLANEGSCESDIYLETTNLQCVSCAIEKEFGAKPSKKWLSLLGFTAQRYHTQMNHSEDANVRKFQQNIAEKIQAYGFCLPNALDSKGRITGNPAYGDLENFGKESGGGVLQRFKRTRADGTPEDLIDVMTRGITGSRPEPDHAEQNELAKAFGFSSVDQMRSLFVDPDWSYMPAAARSDRFERITRKGSQMNDAMVNTSRSGEALGRCLRQIHTFRQNSSMFEVSRDEAGPAAQGAALPDSSNVRLCKSIAKECGMASNNFCTRSITERRARPAGDHRRGPGGPGPGPGGRPGPGPSEGSGKSLFDKGSSGGR